MDNKEISRIVMTADLTCWFFDGTKALAIVYSDGSKSRYADLNTLEILAVYSYASSFIMDLPESLGAQMGKAAIHYLKGTYPDKMKQLGLIRDTY